MAGGDRFAIDIDVGEGASLIAGTAAAEKIYRSTGADAEMDVTLSVGAGGRLCLAAAGNHPVRPRAAVAPHRHRSRRGRVAADGGGGGVRPRRHGRDDAAGRVRPTAGGCAAAASWSLPRTCGSTAPSPTSLAQRAVAAGGIALATVLIAPGDEATLAAGARARRSIRRRGRHLGLERHRAWRGSVARDGARLRHDLIALLAALGAACRGFGCNSIRRVPEYESDAARKRQAAGRHRRHGGAPPARARRQAQPSGSGGADLRFHPGRRARRPDASPN